jgi:hypothetical protein
VECVSKEYGLEINLERTVMLQLLRDKGKSRVVKMDAEKITEVDIFFYLRVTVQKKWQD